MPLMGVFMFFGVTEGWLRKKYSKYKVEEIGILHSRNSVFISVIATIYFEIVLTYTKYTEKHTSRALLKAAPAGA